MASYYLFHQENSTEADAASVDNPKPAAVVLHANDNVGTALDILKQGSVLYGECISQLTVHNQTRFGHKIALTAIALGEHVRKYGLPIGKASRNIKAGEHVHTHNLVTLQDSPKPDAREGRTGKDAHKR